MPAETLPHCVPLLCTYTQGESNTSAALRAYHPDEVTKQDHLEIDTKYYLQHQVHAVVSRLCEPIEGLGAASIAEFLGLDPSGYKSVVRSEDVIDGMGEGGSEGRERVDPFEGVALPTIICAQCKESVEVQGSKVSCCFGCMVPNSSPNIKIKDSCI